MNSITELVVMAATSKKPENFLYIVEKGKKGLALDDLTARCKTIVDSFSYCSSEFTCQFDNGSKIRIAIIDEHEKLIGQQYKATLFVLLQINRVNPKLSIVHSC
jgi:hypothetical protein